MIPFLQRIIITWQIFQILTKHHFWPLKILLTQSTYTNCIQKNIDLIFIQRKTLHRLKKKFQTCRMPLSFKATKMSCKSLLVTNCLLENSLKDSLEKQALSANHVFLHPYPDGESHPGTPSLLLCSLLSGSGQCHLFPRACESDVNSWHMHLSV